MTPTTPTTVLTHGGGTYTVTSAFAAPQSLPPGTYGIEFHPLNGYSIVTLPDLQAPTYRVYGRRDETIAKVLRTYGHLTRSLGVLFEGDKGIGKSSTTVELARQARDLFDVPVFLVNHDTPGLADLLGSLGEAVIVFDEFEKNFPRRGDEGDKQAQFLTLFDGTDATKRLYIVTVNDTEKLSPYLLNRPGRFHYLISFDYPDAQAVSEYISNEVPGASAQQVADVVSFAYRARLNYDHLRAVATELSIAGPDEKVADLVADLNIRDTVELLYDVTVHLADGTTLVESREQVDMFGQRDCIWFDVPRSKTGVRPYRISVDFDPAELTLDRRTGVLTLDGGAGDVALYVSTRGRSGENLQDWERELLGVLDDEKLDLDDAPEEYAGYRVVRMEFVPARTTHDRFVF